MSGNLNPDIINLFKLKFEENCLSLLLESFNPIQNKKEFCELTENNITARLVGLMKAKPLRFNFQISISRESYCDTDKTYIGLADADESVRIDIKYITWDRNIEYEYYIEAKNLSENDWIKPYNKEKVNAHKQQNRYIETGIQNFITGKYPNGSLLGYVVEGDPDNIIIKINHILDKRN